MRRDPFHRPLDRRLEGLRRSCGPDAYRLEPGSNGAPDHWRAKCPLHPDVGRTMIVVDLGNDDPELYCSVGCPPWAIRYALEVEVEEGRPKRRSPSHATPTSTSTSSARVELATDDPLKQIPASQYLPALTGEVVSAAGRTRCPSPDHPDVHPSVKCYGTRWECFACGAKGTIVDAGSLVSGIAPTGASYFELRRWIIAALGLGAPT